MPEMLSWTCSIDQQVITASNETELAGKIKEHMQSHHNMPMSDQEAMMEARKARRAA